MLPIGIGDSKAIESDFVAGTRRFIDLSVQHASALEGVRATLLGHCLSTHVLLGCVCTYARPDISAPRQLNANISCLLPHCGSPARPYRWPATVPESLHRPVQRASVRRLWPGATHTRCPPWQQVPVASFAGRNCPAFHGFLRRAIFRPRRLWPPEPPSRAQRRAKAGAHRRASQDWTE